MRVPVFYFSIAASIGMKLIYNELTSNPELQEYGYRLPEANLPGCEGVEKLTDDYWKCYVRQLTMSMYHPVGTCAMGKDEDDGAPA